MTVHKTGRETRLMSIRRELELRGYLLKKGRPNFVGAEYGYMIVNADDNSVVRGGGDFPFSLTLDDVTGYLDELKAGDSE